MIEVSHSEPQHRPNVWGDALYCRYSLISLYLGGKCVGERFVGREILKPTKPQRNNATTTDGLKGRRPVCATYLLKQLKKGCVGFDNVLKLGVHCQTHTGLFVFGCFDLIDWGYFVATST